jgi:hypothetical protein
MAWAQANLQQPDGPDAGQMWRPTGSQRTFLLWYYALTEEGRWEFWEAVRRLAKGAGKSPFAAVHSLTELLGPVRLNTVEEIRPVQWVLENINPRDPAFLRLLSGCTAKRVAMPLVQIAATSESQTANTMRMVRAMTAKGSMVVQKYGLDAGKTVIYTRDMGQLEVITSSATAAEGALVTFAVLDETEHWLPQNGGNKLALVIDRNLSKSGSRGVQTCNAWEPGIESYAEQTFDAWVLQEEGRTRTEKTILYDARIAPHDLDMEDDDSLERAIEQVYGDCDWVDQRVIKGAILDIKTPISVGKRFYLNLPTPPETAWLDPAKWAKISDQSPDIVQHGDDIVAFFDGSRTNDSTVLTGCHLETGHVFTIGVWEPTLLRKHQAAIPVPVGEVDMAVENMFERWNVLAFFADVREWESFTKVEWPVRYGEDLKLWSVPHGKNPEPVAWDMRTHVYDFTMAAELCNAEIEEELFTQDGDSRISRHVTNARRYPNKWGISVSKEHPKSPKKIDGCVTMIGARMVRRLYQASLISQNKDEPRSGAVHGFA